MKSEISEADDNCQSKRFYGVVTSNDVITDSSKGDKKSLISKWLTTHAPLKKEKENQSFITSQS